jgi:hypothetical protein
MPSGNDVSGPKLGAYVRESVIVKRAFPSRSNKAAGRKPKQFVDALARSVFPITLL